MQHEWFFDFAIKRIEHLFVIACTEGRNHDRLCFTTGEQGRTVNAWQNTSFRDDLANCFGVAAIDAGTGVDDRVTNDVSFNFFAERFDQLSRDWAFAVVLSNEFCDCFCMCCIDLVAAFLFRSRKLL